MATAELNVKIADLEPVKAALEQAADEIRRLRLALEELGDFACFAPPGLDPCECCLHVTDRVNAVLGGSGEHSG